MNELRLIFSRNGGALTHRLTTSWGDNLGEARPFVPFLSSEDEEDLRWYLEEYMELPIGGALVRARRIEQSLITWGRKLFGAIFDQDDRRALFSSLVDGSSTQVLLTVATRDVEVLRLPWELMANSRGPLTRQRVTIRRQLEIARPTTVYEIRKLPLRILLAVSRPDDSGFLDPRHTTRAMLEALGPLGDGVVVDFCRPASLSEMERMLGEADRAERPYQIVHFDGHGSFDPMEQTSVLYFERDGLGSKLTLSDEVPADGFGALMARRRVPLVILEACHSGQVGNSVAFRGAAPALIEAGVGSVLAMSHAVHVEATRILLARFYAELAEGATIGQALEQGRNALMDQPERWLRRGPGEPNVALLDWFVPQLYQLGQDSALVPDEAENASLSTTRGARRAPAQGTEIGAFPGGPMYGFFGRAHELHRLERRFLKHRAVVLHAMGGMGKTSLAREAAFWWTKPTGLFPDGACFVSFEQGGGARRAVEVIGAYFEGPGFERRSGNEQRQRARELFRTKRVLVVWDNFESVLPKFQEGEAMAPYPEEERAEIYRLFRAWMENEDGLGRLLVTCRPGETGLGAVCKLELEGLARADALAMLHGVMLTAEVKVAHEKERLLELLKAVESHPLSIELVGPHLKNMAPEEIMKGFQALLDEFESESAQMKNRSLKASIQFSLKRLSNEAREAVRWLGLFSGGVFEQVLLDVSQMDPGVWYMVRRELEATALVRREREYGLGETHYLRFHPTLAAEVVATRQANEEGTKERYVEVYMAMREAINSALRESKTRWGLDVMEREEANFRKAVDWGLEVGAHYKASAIGDTLAKCLQWSGRLHERDLWTAWLATEVRKGGFSAEVADREADEARSLFSQGETSKAVEKLDAVIEKLRTTTTFDTAFALAGAWLTLGSIYRVSGWSQKAVPILKESIKQWEIAARKMQAAGRTAVIERTNLSITLGDLAEALKNTGALDEALTTVEKAIRIDRECGNHRPIASKLGTSAYILAAQGHIAEADARYREATHAAQRAGDQDTEATLLQRQGILAYKRGQYAQALKHCQRSLQLFQNIHNEDGVIQACNVLGSVERTVGRLAESRAWHERAQEVALRRADQVAVRDAAQGLGIVCQMEGEVFRRQGNNIRALERFAEAARLIDQSLAVRVETQNESGTANSHSRLARIHFFLGNLDMAEKHALHALLAREIRDRFGVTQDPADYDTLAAIARARGRTAEAAFWEGQHDPSGTKRYRGASPSTSPPDAHCPCSSGKSFLDCHGSEPDGCD